MPRTVRAIGRDLKVRLIRLARSVFGHRSLCVERWAGLAFYSPDGTDERLRSTLQLKRGFYVEIGANDGRLWSNTLTLELFDGWTGVLIEPIPEVYERLKFNRSRRRNQLFNVACVSDTFESSTMRMATANFMSTPLEGQSDLVDRVSHAKEYSPLNEVQVIEVPVLTLTEVLTEARAPRNPNLLSLDVEGGEMEVLRGIDFQRYRFEWILVESRSPNELKAFLSANGYVLEENLGGIDYLYRCA